MSTSARRPNQADIAAKLGVSVSTVSRALANEAGISEAVRLDVHRVARSLGYRSKHVMPAGGFNRRAVALVPLGGATGGLSGFYVGIVEAMRLEATAVGLDLDVRLINEQAVTLDLVKRYVSQAAASAVLLAGIDAWDELVAWCAENDVQAVLVNGSDPGMRMSSVSPANFYGAYLATNYLIDAGHRRILHYTHQFRPTIRERRRGFEAAIAESDGAEGVILNTETCSIGELCEGILANRYGVTALFCWNDIAAVELIEGLRGEEAAMPAHFSIIGFDDLPLAGMTAPRLTTIHVEREAIGRGAVRLLMQHMDGEPVVQQLEIGVSLVAGGTVQTVG
ncbi:LacI family DNA-binding transcriptional regulator [Pelagibacterium xiamenense]|uniref:LacI family DNA-binding transcriptional regulator n=1 Tax=Pelagibacterium xiamenense TaxID=2901140 RepID=UPI001E45B8CD|nr:LacI family DNA-binding transcriptional regulator [Pelagibacterium xiamenense]MCD7059882.1 LacI family transcriptional regulator [Pelagibacterium xiamenense]